MKLYQRWIFTVIAIMILLGFSACGNDSEEYHLDGEDIHITKGGTVYTDQTIKGNLYVDPSVKDGNVTLKNLTVEGEIHINGGGTNSVSLANVFANKVIIDSKYHTRVVTDEQSEFETIEMATAANLEYNGSNTPDVAIDTEADAEVSVSGEFGDIAIASQTIIDLSGIIDKITIEESANKTTINLGDGSVVHYFSYYGNEIYIYGGQLDDVLVGADYATILSVVGQIRSEVSDVHVNIHDKEYILPAEVSGEGTSFFYKDYPQANLTGDKISVLYLAYRTGTVHIMVENEEYGANGMSAKDVRDGISPGAGNPDYTVLKFEGTCDEILNEYEYLISMALIMGGDGDNGPPENAVLQFKGYVFVVFEDRFGNLSSVYTFHF